MPPKDWTVDSLVALIGDRRVSARSAAGDPVAVPEALRSRLGDQQSQREGPIADIFRDDRAEFSLAWWDVVQHPDVEITKRLRIRRGPGPYAWENITLVNLLGDPSLNVMLSVVEPTGEIAPDCDTAGVQVQARTRAMIQYLDGTGQIVAAYGDVADIYGRSADEVHGVLPLTLISPNDLKRLIECWVALLADPSVMQQYTIEVPRPDGSMVMLETTLLNRLGDPAIRAVVAVSHDVTERVMRARALDASERRFRRLVENFPTPVFTADATGLLHSLSEPAKRIVSCENSAPAVLWDLAAPREHAMIRAAWNELVSTGEFDIVAEDRTQSRFLRFRASISGLTDADLDEILCTVEDVTAEMAERNELSSKVTRDEQTGVSNRTGLRLGWERLRRNDRPIGVLFLDLDDFKQVNDSYGHAVGDEVLAEIGSRLRSFVRSDQVVARFGGDEFIILFPLASPVEGSAMLDRFRHELCRPVLHSSGVWSAQISVGYVEAQPRESLEAAVARADRSMYEDKARRKATDRFYVS